MSDYNRPEGWELKNTGWDPDGPEGMNFEWRWQRKRHCDQDFGDPHVHCRRCGDVLNNHPGGMACPAPTGKSRRSKS